MYFDNGKETAESQDAGAILFREAALADKTKAKQARRWSRIGSRVPLEAALWKIGVLEICHSTKRTQFDFVCFDTEPAYPE
jgi:hypothetical protein